MRCVTSKASKVVMGRRTQTAQSAGVSPRRWQRRRRDSPVIVGSTTRVRVLMALESVSLDPELCRGSSYQ
jgi:transposase